MSDTLDYGKMMHAAMRGLIKNVMLKIQENGLPGDHHFFITFTTTHPAVQLSDRLFDTYPEEMTIVLQNWFANLEVNDDGFAITLSFSGQAQNLYVPLDAITSFVDPSVEFGLRFDASEEDDAEDAPQHEAEIEALLPSERERDAGADEARDDKPQGEAEIVSLDQFRKS